MKMKRYLLLLLLLINFCFANENNPLYVSSKSLPNYNQQNFLEYINENKQWLKDNRVFLSKNQNLELSLNTPFEKKPINQNVSKGILLVHGLGDSPGYFEDLTQELVSHGFF